MIYLDANIFLYALLNSDEKGRACRQILAKIATRQEDGCTSFLTWDELLHILKKNRERDVAIHESGQFLHFPNLSFINVDETVIFKAQELVKKYALNPRDAIHAASALMRNINRILSDDPDFDKIKEMKRVTIGKF